MDSTLASHDLISPVMAHLRMTGGMLQRAVDRRSREQLAQSVSEAASLAAWLAWDRSEHSTARSSYRVAVKLADSAGHSLLTAYQLGSLAAFMIDRDDRRATAVLQLARHKLGNRPTPVADSWISSLEALAHATAGDERASWTALDRAGTACDKIGVTQPTWPWVFTFDHRRIAAQRVVCAARLGQPDRVLPALPSFADSSTGHRRQGALFALDVAEVWIHAGDPNRGYDLATDAIGTAAAYRSGRVLDRASTLIRHNASRIPEAQLRALDRQVRSAS
jgi:hypothetical protein